MDATTIFLIANKKSRINYSSCKKFAS